MTDEPSGIIFVKNMITRTLLHGKKNLLHRKLLQIAVLKIISNTPYVYNLTLHNGQLMWVAPAFFIMHPQVKGNDD